MTAWRVATRARVGPLEIDVALEGGSDPVALIGPNGCGKTSILKIIAGVFQPAWADIVVGEEVLARSEDGVDLPAEARRVGYVPQGHGLFPNMNVLDNVAFGLSVKRRRMTPEKRREAARKTLRDLDCEHLADRHPEGLSGGERQRVAVARALAIRPALLLLDEPLAALDATARRSVRSFLATHLRDVGCPSLIVTHEPRDVLALNAGVVALSHGKVAQQGSLADLQRAPATDFIDDFVNDLARATLD